MSASKFAEAVGISRNTANEFLQGRTLPHEGTLQKISRTFVELPLAKMQELVLLDTPVDLPGVELLNFEQRGLVREIVRQLLKASGREARNPEQEPRTEDNVVQLPVSKLPDRVKKAAYDPPSDE
ncbi:helix-turn-helix domain-containing protein [Lentzea sp. NPDC092896]|uniref:helix-turn-helix domain-containing protein n=1 Tax=Lentzea sp. NPDC092896 TaxID=3364127 RepID=UPI003800A0B2